METESLKEITDVFNRIEVENNNSDGEKYKEIIYKPYLYKLQVRPKRIVLDPVDFEKYVQENCENKFKILDRLTFHEIKRPIIIFFNHFREKCAYHTKWLDIIYQLAIKYGDRIEFIAGDMLDIDVINSKWDPLHYFTRMSRSEEVFPKIFAINETKRIYQQIYGNQTIEVLFELSENLLNGKLYRSQPITENNETKLVKTCVWDNYEEMILKSTKDILLIFTLEPYLATDPNYENVALQVKDFNVDLVFMDSEKNYIPFEYGGNMYPTILFIPHNDKNKFIYFEDRRTEENLVAFLKEIIEQPEIIQLKRQEQQARIYSKLKPPIVAKDFEMDFEDLPQYLKENFNNTIKVLDRRMLDKIKDWIIIIYMNFQGKCLTHHIEWLNKIFQISGSNSFSIEYLIADYQDIDLINTKWQPSDFIDNTNPKAEIPKIFGMDIFKHTYELVEFKTVASLFYFTCALTSGDFYYSSYPRNQNGELVKSCVAYSLNRFLKQTKKDVFITFYDSAHKEAEKLLDILEEIAKDIRDKNLSVEVVKFDAQESYVDLEYAHHKYPVFYFISRLNKKKNVRFINDDLSKENILEFINKNIHRIN